MHITDFHNLTQHIFGLNAGKSDHDHNHDDDHDHDHDHENDHNDVLTAKGTAMAVLFAASMLAGCLPLLVVRLLRWNILLAGPRTQKAISACLSFGGGVLLATTFTHLLPEVREQMASLQRSGQIPATHFPLAELLMCCGFYVIYAISELVHSYIRSRQQSRHTDGTATCESAVSSIGHHSHVPHLKPATDANGNSSASRSDHFASVFRGLLIVLALSVHELFEGMALGLERSAAHVWLFFAAIASHKLVLAFCVGIELLVAGTSRWLTVGYVLLFAIVSPLGIGIGMAVSGGAQNKERSSVAGVVLQALATGTLLYVVFFEILKKSGAGMVQFAAAVLGFVVMFGLQLASHGHSHGDDEHSDGDHGHSHTH